MGPAAASCQFASRETTRGAAVHGLALRLHMHDHCQRSCFAVVQVLRTRIQGCLQEGCNVPGSAHHLVVCHPVIAEHSCLVLHHQQMRTRCCLVHRTKGCHPTSRLLPWWTLENHVRSASFDCFHLCVDSRPSQLYYLMGCCHNSRPLGVQSAVQHLPV